MALKHGAAARDRNAESNGVWFDYDVDERYLVARNNNPAYKAFIQAEYAANERALDRKNAQSDKIAERITLEGLCKHILKGWEGVEDLDGNPIPFTPDAAMLILEEHDDRRLAIIDFANERAHYLQKQEEAAVEAMVK